jgi:hypothetical protein
MAIQALAPGAAFIIYYRAGILVVRVSILISCLVRMFKPRRIVRLACEAQFSGQQSHRAELTKSKTDDIETAQITCLLMLIAAMID